MRRALALSIEAGSGVSGSGSSVTVDDFAGEGVGVDPEFAFAIIKGGGAGVWRFRIGKDGLREDDEVEVLELCKGLIGGDELVAASECECSEVGVHPEFG